MSHLIVHEGVLNRKPQVPAHGTINNARTFICDAPWKLGSSSVVCGRSGNRAGSPRAPYVRAFTRKKMRHHHPVSAHEPIRLRGGGCCCAKIADADEEELIVNDSARQFPGSISTASAESTPQPQTTEQTANNSATLSPGSSSADAAKSTPQPQVAEQVLEETEQSDEPNHPSTVSAEGDVALNSSEQGKHEEALSLQTSDTVTDATPEQVSTLTDDSSTSGGLSEQIKSLCDLLTSNDARVVIDALDDLDNILKAGQNEAPRWAQGSDKSSNLYIDYVDEAAVATLEQLQAHSDEEVYKKALHILESYFEEEGEQGEEQEEDAVMV